MKQLKLGLEKRSEKKLEPTNTEPDDDDVIVFLTDPLAIDFTDYYFRHAGMSSGKPS